MPAVAAQQNASVGEQCLQVGKRALAGMILENNVLVGVLEQATSRVFEVEGEVGGIRGDSWTGQRRKRGHVTCKIRASRCPGVALREGVKLAERAYAWLPAILPDTDKAPW